MGFGTGNISIAVDPGKLPPLGSDPRDLPGKKLATATAKAKFLKSLPNPNGSTSPISEATYTLTVGSVEEIRTTNFWDAVAAANRRAKNSSNPAVAHAVLQARNGWYYIAPVRIMTSGAAFTLLDMPALVEKISFSKPLDDALKAIVGASDWVNFTSNTAPSPRVL